KRIRVPEEHGARCEKLLLAGTQLLSPEPIWWNPGRTDQAEQAILLWRFPGHAAEPGDRHRVDLGSHGGKSQRKPTGRCFRPHWPRRRGPVFREPAFAKT